MYFSHEIWQNGLNLIQTFRIYHFLVFNGEWVKEMKPHPNLVINTHNLTAIKLLTSLRFDLNYSKKRSCNHVFANYSYPKRPSWFENRSASNITFHKKSVVCVAWSVKYDGLSIVNSMKPSLHDNVFLKPIGGVCLKFNKQPMGS